MHKLTIIKPDDWHVHLRDGEILEHSANATATDFARALIMPNLDNPVDTKEKAIKYKQRIMKWTQPSDFEPFMTFYLTKNLKPEVVSESAKDGIIKAVKFYPSNVTTNAQFGIDDINDAMPVLEIMAKESIPLCIHGEVSDPDVDIFDREAVFIDKVLDPLRKRLPELNIILEHISTNDAVEYVKDSNKKLAATITLHHLILNRNDMLSGGIKPFNYCLPVPKRETHRKALVEAAISDNESFFFGSDSAPHCDSKKLAPCGCAGVYSAPYALPYLAQVFENANAIHKLEAFTSFKGADFYGVKRNERMITLRREPAPQIRTYQKHLKSTTLTIFNPKIDIHWRTDNY